MRVLLFFGLCLLFGVGAMHGAFAQPLPPLSKAHPAVGAQNFAGTQALAKFKDLVTDDNYQLFGFASRNEVRLPTVQLGVPFGTMYVRLDHLRTFASAGVPVPPLNLSGTILYPVLVGTAVRSSFAVTLSGNQWRMRSVGRANFIKAVTQAREAAMQQQTLPASAFVLVQVPALNVFLLAFAQAGGVVSFLPIFDDARLGLKRGQAPVPATTVMPLLGQLAKQTDGGAPN
jgi:hypothetical protein